MENILEAKALSKSYGNFAALSLINLQLPKGKIVGLLGPNGSGKTTLIKIISGLLTASTGTVEVDGIQVGPETKALVSYLPERTYFDETLKVKETIDLFSDFYADFDRARAEEMLQRLGISTDLKFKTLSKGTKEKVQLVMVMSRKAKLYLLDEPIGGVDPATREYVLNTIINNYDPEATVLISTHLITDVERVLDEFIFLNNGVIVMQGNCDAIREERGLSIDALFREVFRC